MIENTPTSFYPDDEKRKKAQREREEFDLSMGRTVHNRELGEWGEPLSNEERKLRQAAAQKGKLSEQKESKEVNLVGVYRH